MSLARFGCEGSDVYVYEDATRGGYTCQAIGHHFNGDAAATTAHLLMHRNEGVVVPADALAELAKRQTR